MNYTGKWSPPTFGLSEREIAQVCAWIDCSVMASPTRDGDYMGWWDDDDHGLTDASGMYGTPLAAWRGALWAAAKAQGRLAQDGRIWLPDDEPMPEGN